MVSVRWRSMNDMRPTSNSTLSLTLAGDFFLGSGFDHKEAAGIKKFLEQQTLALINFEGGLPGGQVRRKAVNLAMDTDVTSYLPNTIVSLSNNHVLDFGQVGLQATCKALDDVGIGCFVLETSSYAGDN